MPHPRLLATSALILLTLSSTLEAQQPPDGANWSRVKALPANTRVHIATNHGGKTCRIFAITDDTLTCAQDGKAGTAFQRIDIDHIKLTHYGRSALVGAGVGGGVGAISGAIAGRSTPCPSGQGFCLNGIGIGTGGVAAIFGVAGAIVGGAVGGLTDLARGSSIYKHP